MLQNWSISPATGLIHARMDDAGNYNPSPNPFGAAGRDIALTVKQTEPLYWLCRMILLLRQRNATVPTPVLNGTRRLAVGLYKIYEASGGDLGFAVNVSSGTMAMGGSTGGALVPGAFALASQVLGEPAYLAAGVAFGEKLWREWILEMGMTTSAPCDTMQSPDDQSGHELTQSLTIIYEVAKNTSFLEMALDAAYVGWAPWIMSYDYKLNGVFQQTPWAQANITSMPAGQPFASPQNREPTPGRCVGSGVDLFRLWRYTNDDALLDMWLPTLHNQMLYMGTVARPLPGVCPGCMSERVPIGDGCNGMEPGVIYGGSVGWPDISAMLSALDNPGVYVLRDTQRIVAADHVEATAVAAPPPAARDDTGTWHYWGAKRGGKSWGLRLRNPTIYNASVCVFVEDTVDRSKALSVNAMDGCKRILLGPGAVHVLPM